MKVADILERRKKHWQELEQYCDLLQNPTYARTSNPALMTRFAALYRAACADLALADSYHLPQNTVQYLHRLVGRAHNQLYRSREFDIKKWTEVLLFDVPQRIFGDRCVQVAFGLFWGLFLLSAYLAAFPAQWPQFAESVLGAEQIAQMEQMFEKPIDGSERDGNANAMMAGFYIQHNTSIGLQCFTWMLLVIPGLLITMFNAITLGTSFGYMARPDVPEGANFFHFVTAHGPFELTAIVLSAGAGLRLGLSWMITNGLDRLTSLQKTGREAMPIMGAAMVMFFLAALIEGFLSPSAAPYSIKAAMAIFSSCLLAFYFGVLGFPRK